MTEWSTPHLKVILIGNSGVGKSSFMTRFVDHRFTKLYRATIGVDFLAKEVTIDKRSVILQVSPNKAQQWCSEIGAEYFECSAKEDVGVDTTFHSAARAALQYFKSHHVENGEDIQIIQKQQDKKPNKKCYC
ncbi:ras-related protein Rab-7a [Pimephales promelas]|nr:ras-related protein Rab-7a [Pimephales promelas]